MQILVTFPFVGNSENNFSFHIFISLYNFNQSWPFITLHVFDTLPAMKWIIPVDMCVQSIYHAHIKLFAQKHTQPCTWPSAHGEGYAQNSIPLYNDAPTFVWNWSVTNYCTSERFKSHHGLHKYETNLT